MPTVILISGAGGFLGSQLAAKLQEATPDAKLILVDIVAPNVDKTDDVLPLQSDLTDPNQCDKLFETNFGIPETVYCMHGIMSRGSEDNFDLGIKVNVDSVRNLLESTRNHCPASGPPIKFIFTSSLAVYGGPLPDVIQPNTIATPESAYGMGKLTSELFINEYTRRGFVDGRILRLPTVVVRPGKPSNATSAFFSGIIREPLQGLESVCPIGNSIDSPDLDLAVWVASPSTTIINLAHAREVPASKILSHTRVICLPGFTTTVREELLALEAVGGKQALQFVRFQDDPTNRRVVSSWPARFDNSYGLGLGFSVDEGGMEPLVRQFVRSLGL
ncbi:NAD(P)-binding protein [Pluteus cervinus]|uniref:NAD(P)-binding protein n=1 Tax=Pluteus cervinus TaxID=181527 RepID=A0ACD3AF15_9AGAR|nr:NAD(P)-binding protein [Pluteus cervinus]